MARPRHTDLAHQRSRELRSDLTISEARLWSGIKNRACGARFRRQVPIGIWIADFASFDPQLVIEVDDRSHDWRDETKRTADIEAAGFEFLRFTNKEIATDVLAVLSTIERWDAALKETGRPPHG